MCSELLFIFFPVLQTTHHFISFLDFNINLAAMVQLSEDSPIIYKADLENHNKDGGLWTVIHGKVYDVQSFKIRSVCGIPNIEDYSGIYVIFFFWNSFLIIHV